MSMEPNECNTLNMKLRVPRRKRSEIERELRTHVEDVRRSLLLDGWDPKEAAREASLRFGSTEEVARAFEAVYRPSRRTQIGLALGLAMGMLLGGYGLGGSLASARSTQHRPTHHIILTCQKNVVNSGGRGSEVSFHKTAGGETRSTCIRRAR